MDSENTPERAANAAPANPARAAIDRPFDPVSALSQELSLPASGVSAVVKLLAEGATVPFISRYRKEATGGLDEVAIRAIEERRLYLLELDERRKTVVAEIDRQGKLTPELAKRILGCATKAELEDFYLPYKPKRRTKATIARERGLEPLADRIWAQPGEGDPSIEAIAFISEEKGVADALAALSGARDICAERIAEKPEVRKLVRDAYAKDAVIRVQKEKEHEDKVTKFDMYVAFEEPIATIPSHRFLAIRRGEAEGVLRAAVELDGDALLPAVQREAGVSGASPWKGELEKASQDAYKRLVGPAVQSDLRIELKLKADQGAVDVFAQNLRELLLSAPYGSKTVLGIDPGQRTGCKCVIVDATGKVIEDTVIYLVQGAEATERARRTIRDLCKKHSVTAIAVGNGTHGRETEAVARQVLTAEGLTETFCVSVSEAGASIYSASEIAREEFPNLDVTVRGAISIARRLQDPLAELVKIDPKSIGVGQYQHDVYQPMLAKKLNEVVESCVNAVGVELNTASVPLLARVAGIGASLAKKIVAHRDEKGAFPSRKALLDVPGLGPRSFEQAAGFLRVRGGEHPLDASAVHPERYALVERMATDLSVPVASLIGDPKAVDQIDPRKYIDGEVGTFTMNDILAELKKPGRDPRKSFEPPKFRDDVQSMQDLKLGMELEGVVTNVTAFGAFVDVGVHQDGLVHVSKLSDRFIKDPSEVVKVGDKIRVHVMEVDLVRKRISLSARKDDAGPPKGGAQQRGGPPQGQPQQRGRDGGRGPDTRGKQPQPQPAKFTNNPFATLLRK